MNWKVILSVIIIASAVLVTGCQFAYDFWPAEISPLAIKYAGREPNSVKWYDKNLHTARELKNQVIDTYIDRQLRLDYLANLNKEKYQQVIGILDLSITQAEQDRQTALGTIAQPGWLLAGLLTLLPVGSYVAGWRTLWPSHYTEEEVKVEIAKAKSPNA
ncbi:MAG: hypothetical protein KJ757_08035 [Planctomycetes bacterium]|nr:hypothetical protein [Planctomycetota bacterium]MBU1517801.1 hypothetical protein [Planctomycetota bacterium]MBU2457285.1 hypothetical protein [Planctomycetota bacterium]MBU2597490.1 hypothetical protein [Planctomycetota bacterium]